MMHCRLLIAALLWLLGVHGASAQAPIEALEDQSATPPPSGAPVEASPPSSADASVAPPAEQSLPPSPTAAAPPRQLPPGSHSQADRPQIYYVQQAPARPKSLRYREGPVPEGYVIQKRSRPYLWIPGMGVFGAAYVLGVGFLLESEDESSHGTGPVVLPIVGPLITLGTYECPHEANECEGRRLFMGFDAAVQAAGATLFVLGLVLRRKRFLRSDLAGSSLVVTPQLTGAAPGLSLRGTF